MRGVAEVRARMLVLGRVAAPDVPAAPAEPKVHPRVAHRQALFAAVGVGADVADLVEVRTCRHGGENIHGVLDSSHYGQPMRARAILVGLVALVVAACGSGGDDEKSSPSTTKAPATSAPTTTAGVQVGDEVTAQGTQLTGPSSPDTRQIDPELACRTFVETPEGQCEIVMMAGGNALWTLDAGPDSGTGERDWRVRIRVRSKTMPDGGWDVALQLPESATFANVAVRAADVTGDGRPELLVGYRAGGTGQFESYDVVTYEPGGELGVAAHRDGLHKGLVALEGTSIVDYSADEESPECCPTRVRRTVIAFGNGVFRVTEVGEVPIDQQPPDLFA
jgi:hypothetical protein